MDVKEIDELVLRPDVDVANELFVLDKGTTGVSSEIGTCGIVGLARIDVDAINRMLFTFDIDEIEG